VKNLKVRQKLALMAAVFMIPFAVVTWQLVASVNRLGIEFARQELRGLEYYPPLIQLLKDFQQHRGMANAYLGGDASFKDALAARRAAIEQDLQALDAVDARLDGALHTSALWRPLANACRELLPRVSGLSPQESFAQHSQRVDELLALITRVGDNSNLTLDPDLDSYYLMNVVVFQGPRLTEMLAQARGLGAGLIARGSIGSAEREQLSRLANLAEHLHGEVEQSMDKAFGAAPALRVPLEARRQASSAALKEAEGLIMTLLAGRGGLSSADYFAAMTRAIDAILALDAGAATELERLVQQRVQRLRGDVMWTLAAALLGLLAVSALGLLISRDITRPLQQLLATADRVAAGDLASAGTDGARRDELGRLGQSFERMVGALSAKVKVAARMASGDLSVSVPRQSQQDAMGQALANMAGSLSALVGKVQETGIQVRSSVTEIAATSKQQQATASEIAATTSEIGATSREITATSRELLRTMNEVAAVAEQSAALAGGGQAGLARMEQTMGQVMAAAAAINAKLAVLNEKASNIGQVVTTINKVADQTNLLSLNAAIEAEKAGEYGRGFSVVAVEIRRLADQTAIATHDIEQTVREIQSAVAAGVMGMDKFAEEVRRGIGDVQQIGGQLSQVIEQVQTLAPRFDSVNEGMQAQATGAEQISQALTQLGEAAQQTVESLRQSTQAIDELNRVAGTLREGISRFRLAEPARNAEAEALEAASPT